MNISNTSNEVRINHHAKKQILTSGKRDIKSTLEVLCFSLDLIFLGVFRLGLSSSVSESEEIITVLVVLRLDGVALNFSYNKQTKFLSACQMNYPVD